MTEQHVPAVEDFSDIAARLREIKSEGEAPKARATANPTNCLCNGFGWIGVWHREAVSGRWRAMVCPDCRNPAGFKTPRI
jgi:hypothetical protein